MKNQDIILLPLTVCGTPSGNYDGSSLDWAGDREKAVGFYRQASGKQTVVLDVNGFDGTMIVQGSLDDDPAVDGDWFRITEYGPGTYYLSETLTGNFAWIRVRVIDFVAGTINSVTLSY